MLHRLRRATLGYNARVIPLGLGAAGAMALFALFFEWDARRFLARCGWEEAADLRWGFLAIAMFVFLLFGNWLSSRFPKRWIRWTYRVLYVAFWCITIARVTFVSFHCDRMPRSSRYLCSFRLKVLQLALAEYYDVHGISAVAMDSGDHVTAGQWRVKVLPCSVLAESTRPSQCVPCKDADAARPKNTSLPPQVEVSPVCPEHLRCPCEPGPITASSYFAVLPPTRIEAEKHSLAPEHGQEGKSAHTGTNEYTPRGVYPIVELPGYGRDWRADGVISFEELCDVVFTQCKSDNGCFRTHVHKPLAISTSGQIVELTQIRDAAELFKRLFDGG